MKFDWILVFSSLILVSACNVGKPSHDAEATQNPKQVGDEYTRAMEEKTGGWLDRLSKACVVPPERRESLVAESRRTADQIREFGQAFMTGQITAKEQMRLERQAVAEYRQRVKPIVADLKGSPVCANWLDKLVNGPEWVR